MMSASTTVYDLAFGRLLDLFLGMIEGAEKADPQAKWDDEFAEHAVAGCLDRLINAGPMRPHTKLRERYRDLRGRAAPYLDEDVPLPVHVKPVRGTIQFRGKTLSDAGDAIDEAKRRIQDGLAAGKDQNEDGAFIFEVSTS